MSTVPAMSRIQAALAVLGAPGSQECRRPCSRHSGSASGSLRGRRRRHSAEPTGPVVASPATPRGENRRSPPPQAVHSQQYIERLASTCVPLRLSSPRSEEGAASSSLRLMAILSSRPARPAPTRRSRLSVDAVCDAHLPYKPFAVVRPPGTRRGQSNGRAAPLCVGQSDVRARQSPRQRRSRSPRCSATVRTALKASAC